MKKRLLLIITALVIVMAAIIAVACDDDGPRGVKQPKPDYTVTVSYDDYRGTVVVTDADGNDKTVFKSGDTVTVSIEAKTGFALVNLTVGGEKQQLSSDGKYSFKIAKDTEIVAAFGMDAIGQEVLDASKENLLLEGIYEYTEEGQRPTTFTKKTVFGTDSIYLLEKQEDGTASIDEAYVDKNGVLTLVKHTIHNEVDYVPVIGESFADYYNPFAKLTPDDFELTDKADVFGLKAEKRSDASMPLTGWNDVHLARFEVTVAGGKITYIEIETADNAAVGGTLPYHSLYKFTVSEHGEAELEHDLLNPFTHKDEHDVLRNALMEMSQVDNYTVNIKDSEFGYVDILYNAYVTEDLIYEDCEDYENGYVILEDQKVYPFDYDPNAEAGETKATLFDPLKNITSVAMLHASFIGGYEMELFELTEDGDDGKVFTLRCDEFAGDIFKEFGDGVDKMKYYEYALNGKIMLDDENKLMGAEFECYVYGSHSTVTLIYADVNSTEAPELDFTGAAKVSMYDDYVGTYVDRFNPESTVVISKEDGIVIDGVSVEVITYSRQYDLFVVDYEGVDLYVGRKTARQLTIYDLAFINNEEDYIFYEFILETDEEVVIEKPYRGEWSGVCYYEQEHNGSDVAYSESTETITCNFEYLGGACVITGSNGETVDTLTFTLDGDTLTFERAADVDEKYAGEIIPLKYTGGYTATMKQGEYDINFILVITNDEIVLTLRGEDDAVAIITRSTVTLMDNGEYELEVLSCDEENGLVCYDNGYTYYFKLSSSKEKLFVTIADGAYLIYDQYVLGDKEGGEETIDIPEEFIGAYFHIDSSTLQESWLVVSEKGVKFVRNGYMALAVPVEVVEVKPATGSRSGTNMIFEYDGVEYTVFLSDEYIGVTDGRVVTITSGTSYSATYQYQDIWVDGVPEKFYGDYMSKDSEYMVCIDENGVTILATSDDYFEDDEITLVGADEAEIEITAGGVTYYIGAMASDENGSATVIWLSDEDDNIGVALYRVTA